MDDRTTRSSGPGKRLWLPIAVGLVALAVYFLTASPWMIYFNAEEVATLGGWSWAVESNVFVPPLLYLLTIPLRLFPDSSIPFLLNLFSTVLGAGSAFFLALTIRLLPQDRTRDQRTREKSSNGFLTTSHWWVPVVAGSLLFIFQLTIWESSTLYTKEILNLFLFSVITWSIFNARLTQSSTSLATGAFVTGIALANDGGLFGFLPFILAGFIWVRKKELFSFHVFIPLFGCFLMGCLLYLTVPFIHTYSGADGVGYFDRLFSYLGTQKSYILLRDFRIPNFFLALTSVLPLIFASVRWPSQFGDMTAVGAFFTQSIFRVFHFIFLITSFYVSFDMAFSPRQSGHFGLLYLRYQYLTCLAAGYYLGYFILILSRQMEGRRKKKTLLPPQLANILAWGLSVIALALPLALAVKNAPFIQARNQTPWRTYIQSMADVIVKDNPANGFVASNTIFGGASAQLLMLRSILPDPITQNLIFLDSSSAYLNNPKYHRLLKKRYGDRYPELPELPASQKVYSNPQVSEIFARLIKDNQSYYLNATYGLFFETVRGVPEKGIYHLESYSHSDISYPIISQKEAEDYSQLADSLQSNIIESLSRTIKIDPPRAKINGQIRRTTDPQILAMLVSVHLNDIGYRLMRSHHYAIAHKYLSMAIASNPENISAEINQFALDLIQKNGDSLAGLEWKFPPEMEENINEKLKGFANLEVLLNTYGFFDFPSLTFMLSRTFFENGLPIQAYQFLQRTLELEPTVYRYYADGAMFVLNYNRTDIAMEILDKLRKNVTITDLDFEDQNIDLKIQSQILQMSGKLDEAVSLLRQSATDEPKRASTLRFLATIYERAGQFDKVVETCHEQIELFPQDFRAWLQLGLAHSFLNQFDEALNANNKALEINPRFSLAHKNNAFIFSKMENWAKVIESLQAFLKTNPSYYDALLEIARSYRRLDDKVNAIKYYQEYLLSLGKGSPESIAIQVELDEYRGDMDED